MPTRSEGARESKNFVAAERTKEASSSERCMSSKTRATKRCGSLASIAVFSTSAAFSDGLAGTAGDVGRGTDGVHVEGGQQLRFAIIENLKILAVEIGDDFAVLIANNHTHLNEVCVNLEGGRSVAGCHFGGCFVLGGRWRGRFFLRASRLVSTSASIGQTSRNSRAPKEGKVNLPCE